LLKINTIFHRAQRSVEPDRKNSAGLTCGLTRKVSVKNR